MANYVNEPLERLARGEDRVQIEPSRHIPEGLEQQAHVITSLRETVETLVKRLQPVMGPGEHGESAVDPVRGMSSIAECLVHNNREIYLIQETVEFILGSLDV